jgi:hypothetical protein
MQSGPVDQRPEALTRVSLLTFYAHEPLQDTALAAGERPLSPGNLSRGRFLSSAAEQAKVGRRRPKASARRGRTGWARANR